MNDFDILELFTAQPPRDLAKQGLELTCTACGTAVCDIDPDSLSADLVNAADRHWRESHGRA